MRERHQGDSQPCSHDLSLPQATIQFTADEPNDRPTSLRIWGIAADTVGGLPAAQHGLSFFKMALVTSNCGTMRSPSVKWR